MAGNYSEELVVQLKVLADEWSNFLSRSKYEDASDLPETEIISLLTRAHAAIERASSKNSAYVRKAHEIMSQKAHEAYKLRQLIGVVHSLILDIDAGYLKSAEELIHGELFGDFLEMASHLMDSGYKDAAAVISGSTLEAHLRQMCIKTNIDTVIASKSGSHPKKADQMNAELSGAAVYSKLDQKNITAWLDLRNKAAHGQYKDYTKEQVSLMISGIRDFLTRNPA